MDIQRVFRKTCLSVAITHAIAVPAAHAATITVNSLGDVSTNNDGVCTLREAIQSANQDSTTNGCTAGDLGANQIEFSVAGVLALTQGSLLLSEQDLTLQGPGQNQLTIDASANGVNGVFTPFGTSSLTINDLTITGASGPNAGGTIQAYDAGDITINRTTISSSSVPNKGGAILVSNGNLFISDSTLSDNSANIGGAIHISGSGTTTLTNTQVDENDAGQGGGIYFGGSVSASLTNSTLSANVAGLSGGGMRVASTAYVEVDGGDIEENIAGYRGGGAYVQNTADLILNNVTVSTNSAGSGQFQRYGGGVAVASAGTLKSTGTLWENNYGTYGGAVATRYANNAVIEIEGDTFRGNYAAAQGGAFRTRSPHTLTINNSTIEQNSALNTGGGLTLNGSGSATITNSVLNSNQARQGGAISVGGPVKLINSTISDNQASAGGGMTISGSAEFESINSTIVGNRSVQSNTTVGAGGGIRVFGATSADLVNSIVAGNTADGPGDEIYVGFMQTFEVDSNNLLGSSETTTANAFSNLVPGISDLNLTSDNVAETRPLVEIVGPLEDNGGPTKTHALVNKSPAIDAGGQTECAIEQIDADQRGEERDDPCDIGAFEKLDSSTFFVIPVKNGRVISIDL